MYIKQSNRCPRAFAYANGINFLKKFYSKKSNFYRLNIFLAYNSPTNGGCQQQSCRPTSPLRINTEVTDSCLVQKILSNLIKIIYQKLRPDMFVCRTPEFSQLLQMEPRQFSTAESRGIVWRKQNFSKIFDVKGRFSILQKPSLNLCLVTLYYYCGQVRRER